MEKPNKCAKCPVALIEQERIAKYNEDIDTVIRDSVDPDLERLAEDTLGIASGLAGREVPMDSSIFEGKTAAELATDMRALMSESMRTMNERIAEIEALRISRQAACLGAMTLRATRNDTQVTVTVC